MKHIFFFFVIISYISCSSTLGNDEQDKENRTVILAYLGGDNNLSSETYEKMNALLEGWTGKEEHKLLIYQDPADESPHLSELKWQNGVKSIKKICNFTEENSASPEVFSKVITHVKSLYPAQSFGLLLFSHATGWLPQGTLNSSPRSILQDGQQEMELKDFAQAIPDKMFDFILFEACFTAGIEVAFELKDKTNYLIASAAEIVSPGYAGIYPASLKYLFKIQPQGVIDFAKSVHTFYDNQTGYRRSNTISVIKTSKLDDLSYFIKEHTREFTLQELSDLQHFDRNNPSLFFDFYDYYSHLITEEENKRELNQLLNDIVIYKSSTPSFLLGYGGFYIHKHSGLTTYVKQKELPALNKEYNKLKWAQAIKLQTN